MLCILYISKAIPQFIILVLNLGKRRINGVGPCLDLVDMRLKENGKIAQNKDIKLVHLALLTLGMKVI